MYNHNGTLLMITSEYCLIINNFHIAKLCFKKTHYCSFVVLYTIILWSWGAVCLKTSKKWGAVCLKTSKKEDI